MWIVRGKLGRHVRTFDVYAFTREEAKFEAEVMIRAVYSRGSGTFGPMTWRCGEITMRNFEDGEVVVLQTQRADLRLLK